MSSISVNPKSKTVTYYGIPSVSIPPDILSKFNPDGVVYYKLGINISKDGYPIFEILDYRNRRNIKIKDFISELFNGGSPVPLKIKSTLSAPSTPYDITIGRQCYLVIELDRKISSWQFDSSDDGVSTSSDYGFKNIDLAHIDDNGDEIQSGSIKESCNVLYFGINSRDGNNDTHKYNLHIEFVGGGKCLKMIFDPDIKNDGGIFP